jgi:hypothetical protein
MGDSAIATTGEDYIIVGFARSVGVVGVAAGGPSGAAADGAADAAGPWGWGSRRSRRAAGESGGKRFERLQADVLDSRVKLANSGILGLVMPRDWPFSRAQLSLLLISLPLTPSVRGSGVQG